MIYRKYRNKRLPCATTIALMSDIKSVIVRTSSHELAYRHVTKNRKSEDEGKERSEGMFIYDNAETSREA